MFGGSIEVVLGGQKMGSPLVDPEGASEVFPAFKLHLELADNSEQQETRGSERHDG